MTQPRYQIGDILYENFAKVHVLIEKIDVDISFSNSTLWYFFRVLEHNSLDKWPALWVDKSDKYTKVA